MCYILNNLVRLVDQVTSDELHTQAKQPSNAPWFTTVSQLLLVYDKSYKQPFYLDFENDLPSIVFIYDQC